MALLLLATLLAIFAAPAQAGEYSSGNLTGSFYQSLFGLASSSVFRPSFLGRRLQQSGGCKTALEVFSSNPDLARVAENVKLASPALIAFFSDRNSQPFTFFAPSNEGVSLFFDRVPPQCPPGVTPGQGCEPHLTGETKRITEMTSFTTFFSYGLVLGRRLEAKSLYDGQILETALKRAKPLTVRTAAGKVDIVSPGSVSTVVTSDIPTCTGVIHVTDRLFLPVSLDGKIK